MVFLKQLPTERAYQQADRLGHYRMASSLRNALRFVFDKKCIGMLLEMTTFAM